MATYSRRRNDDEAGEPIEGQGAPADPRDDVDPLQLPEEEQLVYDLSAWPIDVHAEVAEAMAEAGIGHSWIGTDLVVHDRHEDTADALLAAIERRHGLDSDVPVEREAGSEVEYDLSEWDSRGAGHAHRPAHRGRRALPLGGWSARRHRGGRGPRGRRARRGRRGAGRRRWHAAERGGAGGEPAVRRSSSPSTTWPAIRNDRDTILRLNELFEQSEAGPVPFGVSPSSWEQILDQVSDLLDLSLDAEDVADVKAEALEVRGLRRWSNSSPPPLRRRPTRVARQPRAADGPG